ncbi:MAG: hypothetical protein M1816_007997 [Peltula sp. TS41687]|nr:MAG: hypothetical protein M1816_007997 [Peltula sp. TS41687]
MESYKISATLEGHEDDVRSVAFPKPNVVLSASRDATVRVWKLSSAKPPEVDCTVSSHGSAFINALTYIPPSPQFPEGLIVSGGKDTIIEVRQPGRSPEDNAEALLLGHTGNVCALDVDPQGQWIVSGGWDAEARIWRVGKWECDTVLEGHQGSVWAVLAWASDQVITGCADKLIRVFSTDGRLLRTIRGNTDVVRALCRVPNSHPSGAQFASASNDGVIRLWSVEGQQFGELRGHESFIYSLASLPTGELISSGEDRTVRIWQGNSCIQTITHPAISVWSVAACAANGDIVSGASDKVLRVFSRNQERQATAEALQAFEESVKSSSIPQQQVADINKEKLPGPEFLQQKSGTKVGQVVMIREANGNITAHQWSTATQEWISVGTVVDAVGSSGRKQEYLGQDYDYVFDVDIKEGAPPLKLPYNLSQNPYEAATKFLQDNELPMTYLDQVANFITTSTQGATIGQSQQSEPTGPDPWGTESRYRPGEQSSTPAPPSTTQPPKILPQKTYLSIKQANLPTIQKKIKELNQDLISNGRKDVSLNPSDLNVLESLITYLTNPSQPFSKTIKQAGIELVIRITTNWPPTHRLPGLDLLRLLAAESSGALASYRRGQDENIIDILAASGVFDDAERSNNLMLAIRTFVNLFETDQGLSIVDAEFDKIIALVSKSTSTSTPSTNRNLQISYTTLLINYSVLLLLLLLTTSSTSPSPSSSAKQARAITLLQPLLDILTHATDSEVLYRALVATGTLLSCLVPPEASNNSVTPTDDAAQNATVGLKEKVQAVLKKANEPRIGNVSREILELLR